MGFFDSLFDGIKEGYTGSPQNNALAAPNDTGDDYYSDYEASSAGNFCSNCGGNVPTAANFCPSCGTKMSGTQASATQPQKKTHTMQTHRVETRQAKGSQKWTVRYQIISNGVTMNGTRYACVEGQNMWEAKNAFRCKFIDSGVTKYKIVGAVRNG